MAKIADTQYIDDPRTTGPRGLQGLPGISSSPFRRTPEQEMELAQDIMRVAPPRDLSNYRDEGVRSAPSIGFVGVEGLGDSRFDHKATWEQDLYNLNDSRGRFQSGFEQIAVGVLKGAVLAGTTFADGVIGTPAGLISAATGGSFILNPVSTFLLGINQWSEEALPSYYRDHELNSPWYKNIFTANFIGDKFLKNLGFAVGAAYSGRVNAGMISKGLRMASARKAYKGATEAAKNGYNLSGTAADPARISEELASRASLLKNEGAILKMSGALSAGMGEARIEAIGSADEYIKEKKEILDRELSQWMENERLSLMKEPGGHKYFELIPGVDGQMSLLITPEGTALLYDRVRDQYENGLAVINADAARVANVAFAMNTVLLTASDWVQFGKFYAGGYRMGRKASGIVRDAAGNYVAKRKPLETATNMIKNPLVEGNEEMMQSVSAMGAGYMYNHESYLDAELDPESNKQTMGFIKAMSKSILESYGDIDNYEEFAIGWLTGALGVPSFGGIQGGILGDVRESRLRNARLNNLANELNKLVGEDVKNYYKGLVRNNTFENLKEQALNEGDEYTYKNHEMDQLFSSILTYDAAGRIDDLIEIVEGFSQILESDIEALKEATVNKETGKSVYEGMENLAIIESVKNQGDHFINLIREYQNISENIKVAYGRDHTEEGLKEITWLAMRAKDWEGRFNQLYDEVRQSIEGITFSTPDGKEIPVSILFSASPKAFLEALLPASYTELADIAEAIKKAEEQAEKAKKDIASSGKRSKKHKKALDALKAAELIIKNQESIVAEKNAVIKKMQDMQRIIEDRYDALKKYDDFVFNPSKLQKEIDGSKKKAQENLKKSEKAEKTKGNMPTVEALKAAKTMTEFKRILSGYTIDGASEEHILASRTALVDELSKDGDNHPIAKRYMDIAHTKSAISDALSLLRDIQNKDGSPVFSMFAVNYANRILNILSDRVDSGAELRNTDNPIVAAMRDELDVDGNNLFENKKAFDDAVGMFNRAVTAVNKSSGVYGQKLMLPSQAAKQPVSSGTLRAQKKPETKPVAPVLPPVTPKQKPPQKEEPKKEEPKSPTKNTDSLSGESKEESRRQYLDPQDPMVTKNNADFPGKDGIYKKWKPGVSEFEVNGMKVRNAPVFTPLGEAVPQYTALWNFLKDKGAFEYVNKGNLKEGDVLTFGVDPELVGMEGIVGAPILIYKGDQIVGTLPNNTRDKQGNVINRHEHLLDSLEAIRQEYRDFLAASHENKNKRFTSSLSTTVESVLPGRMVFTHSFSRPLNLVTGIFDQPITFAISVGGVIQTPHVEDSHLDAGVRNPHKRNGGIWLRVKGADGLYYYASVTIKHFNPNEFNLSLAVVLRTNTYKQLRSIIGRIYDAEIFGKGSVTDALNELQSILYFQGDLHVFYSADNGGTVRVYQSVDGRGPKASDRIVFSEHLTVGLREGQAVVYDAATDSYSTEKIESTMVSKDSFIDSMMSLLQELNPRFQVSSRSINTPGYNESLASDGILETHLKTVEPGSAWFWMNPVKPDGTLVKAGSRSKPPSGKPTSTDAGNRGVNPLGGSETVSYPARVNYQGKAYNVNADGTIDGTVDPAKKGIISDLALISLFEAGLGLRGTKVSRTRDRGSVRLQRPNGSAVWLKYENGKPTGFIGAELAAKLEKAYQEHVNPKTEKTEARSSSFHDTLKIINDIKENTKSMQLSSDNSVYVDVRSKKTGVVDSFDENGNLIINKDHYTKVYDRVTSVISDSDVGDSPLIESALTIGTQVDQLMRDFFDGVDIEANAEWYDVADKQVVIQFAQLLKEIKRIMDARGETPISDELVLHDDVLGVAGTIDLMTYDKAGVIRIYDVKTMRGNQLTSRLKNGQTKYDHYNRDKHQKQLSAYRMLLHNTYGILAKELAILPIEISYNAGDSTTKVLRLLPNSQQDGVIDRFIPHEKLGSIKGRNGKVLTLREFKRDSQTPPTPERTEVDPPTSSVNTTFDPIVYGEDKSGVKGWEPRVVVSLETHRIQWGKSVKIEGFEGYDFFITEDSKGYYTMYEGSTGRSIIPQHRGSQRSVLAIAKQRLDEIGHEKAAEVIGESNKGYDKLDAQALYDSILGSSQEAQGAEVAEVAEVTTTPQEAGTQEDNKKNEFMGMASRVGLKVNPGFAPRQQTQATEGVWIGDTVKPNPNASFEAFALAFPETIQRKGFTKQIWDKLSPQEKIHEINCAIPF